MNAKRVYLDTSVVIVLLFGREKEPERYASVQRLFEGIDAGQIAGLVSVYTVQEVCLFCREHFSEQVPEQVAALALRALFQHDLRLVPLITRAEKLAHVRGFEMHDAADRPHAIAAYVNRCDAIVAYDEHFEDIADKLSYLQPEALLTELEAASDQIPSVEDATSGQGSPFA